jgi:hypothetical protein
LSKVLREGRATAQRRYRSQAAKRVKNLQNLTETFRKFLQTSGKSELSLEIAIGLQIFAGCGCEPQARV